MSFAATLAFVAVVSCARAVLTCGLKRASVENDGAGLALTRLRNANDRAQIVGHSFKTPSAKPSLRLLINGFPRREVGWQQPPRRACASQSAQRVVQLSQIVLPLRGVLFHQCQIGRPKAPFFIRYIVWVSAAFFHPASTEVS